MVCLALGSNIGDRLNNIRNALEKLSSIVRICKKSIVIETEAILPENACVSWNVPYLNMLVNCETDLSPYELLCAIQTIERELGRPCNREKWSPRVIDIDIIFYNDLHINDRDLTIPHPEIKNRPFLISLLNMIGYNHEDSLYIPINSFVLEPKIVGIVNVTPDSFSDGGVNFAPEQAAKTVNNVIECGAFIAELGAQSTRPGYSEVSPNVELERLSAVFDVLGDYCNVGIDTYFDDIVLYGLSHGVRWINDIKGELSNYTLRKIADCGCTIVTMLNGTNIQLLEEKIKTLCSAGISREKIVIDPGIGFGKTRFENLKQLQCIENIKNLECKIMVGHSRKSFMSIFSGAMPNGRDIETLAFSALLKQKGIDYIRVHNVRDHMKFFVADDIIRNR